MSHR
ncbi:hypothetical protein BsWGS_06890 [Bradybaena similaris]